jgi:predicted CxxxxCH...CXXCH cytochrome family protein
VLISLAIGKEAPGDCTSCHGSNFQTVHLSCTGCHSAPPSGATAPNREGAHTEHGVLGLGSVNPSCIACHDGLIHANGSNDVGFLSSFDAKSGLASSNGSTCAGTSCHGGQITPAWLTGAIDVNTQCTSCHAAGTAEYNSYYSGLHDLHMADGMACTACHNPTTLASGHFSNLETPTFEQNPATTIGGTVARPNMTYDGSSCYNTTGCHGIGAAGPWR